MGYTTSVYYKCMQSRPKRGEALDAGEGRGAEEGWEDLDTGANSDIPTTPSTNFI